MSDPAASAYDDAVRRVDELEAKLAEAAGHYDALLQVVNEVHARHADDLCWMPADVNRIFVAAGLPPQDLRVGDKVVMRKNCDRYIDVLCGGGPWVSYAELEAGNAEMARRIEEGCEYVTRLEMELLGERKANSILNAGFVSTCEDRDRLKQRVRELEAELKEGR